MRSSEEIRGAVEALEAEVRDIADAEEMTDDMVARLDELAELLPAERAELTKSEHRDALVETVERQRPTAPAFSKPVDTQIDVRTATSGEVRDAARKILDDANFADDANRTTVERLLNKGETVDFSADKLARRLVVTEQPEYRTAFMKGISGQAHLMDDAERRAMSIGVDTAGGFGVPVIIDPTIMITDGTGLVDLLPYVDVKAITNDEWKGVSGGHTAWSFDAEAEEVSDDTSTLAQPTVTAHATRGFVPYSIEVGMDYPGFANEIARLLADGYMDQMAEKLAVGTGSGQPFGVFVTTTTTVDVTTDNTFGAEDIDAVWKAVPEKFRARSVWFMNVDVENAIRGFGSGTATSRFTVDQSMEGISRLNGKPVVLSDWAPEWAGTDGAKILAVGDFSNFVVAQRLGMTVEYIPHLFGTTNARPTGQRGFFAHARYGSDLVVQNAIRVLKNQTT